MAFCQAVTTSAGWPPGVGGDEPKDRDVRQVHEDHDHREATHPGRVQRGALGLVGRFVGRHERMHEIHLVIIGQITQGV
jgi:hypothetical protein